MNNNNNTVVKRLGFQRTTKFSIDDILGPEFGRKQTKNRLSNLYINYTQILSRNALLKPHQCCLSEIASSRLPSDRAKDIESLDTCNRNSSWTIDFSRSSHIKDQKCSRPNSDDLNATHRPSRDALTPIHINSSVTEAGCPGRSDDRALPAWVYCTRYSDRPSSGSRSRKIHQKPKPDHEKRPRTSFTSEQLKVLQTEFGACRYLTENRRQNLASDLCLNESQIKIWFQNKRAKVKKTSADRKGSIKDLAAHRPYKHATSYRLQQRQHSGSEESN